MLDAYQVENEYVKTNFEAPIFRTAIILDILLENKGN